MVLAEIERLIKELEERNRRQHERHEEYLFGRGLPNIGFILLRDGERREERIETIQMLKTLKRMRERLTAYNKHSQFWAKIPVIIFEKRAIQRISKLHPELLPRKPKAA